MERYFFDKKAVVREISAELKHLRREETMEIHIERDIEGDFAVTVKTNHNLK